MRKSSLRLLVAVTTCAAGIAISLTWSSFQSSAAKAGPCREGLVVVEHQPGAPIGISITSLNCAAGFANIGYTVEGKDRLIKHYQVDIIKTHQGIVDSHSSSSMSTPGAGLTASDLDNELSFVGESLNRGWFREPVDKVRFSVLSVTFADGTQWHSSSTNE